MINLLHKPLRNGFSQRSISQAGAIEENFGHVLCGSENFLGAGGEGLAGTEARGGPASLEI